MWHVAETCRKTIQAGATLEEYLLLFSEAPRRQSRVSACARARSLAPTSRGRRHPKPAAHRPPPRCPRRLKRGAGRRVLVTSPRRRRPPSSQRSFLRRAGLRVWGHVRNFQAFVRGSGTLELQARSARAAVPGVRSSGQKRQRGCQWSRRLA
jgi:hypothetical protein